VTTTPRETNRAALQANAAPEQPSPELDPLIGGNVNLAMRALELGRARAVNAANLAEQERDYAAAEALQTAALTAAGYGPLSPVDAAADGARTTDL